MVSPWLNATIQLKNCKITCQNQWRGALLCRGNFLNHFSEGWLFDKRGDLLFTKIFFQLSTTVLFVSESSVAFNELCSMGVWRKVTRCLFRHRGEAEVLQQHIRNLCARMERRSATLPRRLYTLWDSVSILLQNGWASELVWTGIKNFYSIGIRHPNHPAHSESLFRTPV